MPMVNTHEISGRALEWAVASVVYPNDSAVKRLGEFLDGSYSFTDERSPDGYRIITCEGIATRQHSNGTWYAIARDDLGDGQRPLWCEFTWRNARSEDHPRRQRFEGATMLEAGLRCFLAARVGATIDISAEVA